MKANFKFVLTESLKKQCVDHNTDPKTFLPAKAEPSATGYDVKSAVTIDLVPGELFKIPLGIKSLCPRGWCLELHPRSSSFMKKDMVCLVGQIDQDFNHEIHLVGRYFGKTSIQIEFGERVGQLIPRKITEMETVEVSEEQYNIALKQRGSVRNGGIGSTGNK